MCICEPELKDGYHYIGWIGIYFRDCVYTPLEIIGFISGLVSVSLFLVALFPQLWKNYKRKNVEGLSILFLLIWVFGDISNMLGAILTNQYPIVKYTGIYFVISDMVSLLQYWYYKYWYKGPRPQTRYSVAFGATEEFEDDFGFNDGYDVKNTENKVGRSEENIENEVDTNIVSTEKSPLLQKEEKTNRSTSNVSEQNDFKLLTSTSNMAQTYRPYSTSTMQINSIYSVALIYFIAALPSVYSKVYETITQTVDLCDANPEISPYLEFVGQCFAWTSGLLYFFSRVPQIITNYKLKDVEGLSIMLFILTISSNTTYGLQILIRQPTMDSKFFASTLPYLIGSIGTLIFDLIIILQAIAYGNHDERSLISRARKVLFPRRSSSYERI